jgi:hypothetical protein
MRVTGETFSFYNERKGAEEVKYQKVLKHSGQRTVTGQNSGELYNKKHRWGNSCQLGIHLQKLLKVFPDFLGRIFQVKGQSKNSNIAIFLFCLFLFFYIVGQRKNNLKYR